MPTRFAMIVVLLCFFGCADNGSQPVQLDPYGRWRSYGLHNYTIDQTRSCFCPFGGHTMRITVRSDTVASVLNLTDSTAVPSPISLLYLSVDSLFGIIQHTRGDSVITTFNVTYGYPETLDLYPQLHPVDGGVLYTTSNLHIP